MKRFNFLFEKKDATALGIFRIVFAFLIIIDILRWMKIGFIPAILTESFYLSPYPFLEFLQPLSTPLMQFLLFAALVAMIFILLGIFYRTAMAAFAVLFFYIYYIDETIYNNHLYLVSLLSFAMIFIPADQAISLGKKKEGSVPAWCYWFLRIQFIIVYFFGGIAKLNTDWLVRLEPVETLVSNKGVSSDLIVYFIGYGGLLFDFSIGFLLLFRKTRVLAVIGVLIFNFTNGFYLFDDIYIFPFMMVGATVLFFPPSEVSDLLRKFGFRKINPGKPSGYFKYRKTVVIAFICYFIIQILVPFKQYLFSGNNDWHMQGQKFCWHMKSQTRRVEYLSFLVENKDLERGQGNPEEFVLMGNGESQEQMLNTFGFRSEDKIKALYYNPRSTYHCAQSMADFFRELTGVDNLGVYANVKVSFNKRDVQHLIDPEVDLLTVKYDPIGSNSWIIPLKRD